MQNLSLLEIILIIMLSVLFFVLAYIIYVIVNKNHMIKTKVDSISSLIKVLIAYTESKDDYTAIHHRNVAKLSTMIAEKMNFSRERVLLVHNVAMIHDIGKMNIPGDVLNKGTKLDDSEMELIKSHPVIGYNIIKAMHDYEVFAKIILQHHERVNGSGYPYGLTGGETLMEAKIIAVADTFEAMTSKRPYGKARDVKAVLKFFNDNKGVLFESEVVDIFNELFDHYLIDARA